MLKFVDSQEEFNLYTKDFVGHDHHGWIEFYFNVRKMIFLTRMWMYSALFKWHFRFGYDFNFLTPGLEIKYACEEAEKAGAELHFLGPELNKVTWQRLYHETRFNIPHYLLRRFQYA